MKVGAGRAALPFEKGFFPTEGFTHVADALHARVLLVGTDNPFALVSVEMTSLPPDEVEALKAIVHAEADTPLERIWICVTHTFSAPHIMPDAAMKTEAQRKAKADLQRSLREAVRQATRQAAHSMRDATIALAQGESYVNSNRDIETEAGWWVGCDGPGFSDKTLTVLRIDAGEEPLALILHYAVQSSVLDGSEAVSPDLAGIACKALEARYPGAVVLFIIGAAGDQAPLGKTMEMETTLGRQLAQDVAMLMDGMIGAPSSMHIRIVNATIRLPAQMMPPSLRDLQPTRSYTFTPNGETEQPISILTTGDFAVVGVRPELNAITAKRIADASPHKTTLVATLVNGGAKYMADTAAYERITYEAMNSPFARGAAEILQARVLELLSSQRQGGTP